jgi:Na+/proline symporter
VGGSFRKTQLWLQVAMQVVIFGLQLTAGAELLSFVTGTSYQTTVIIMIILPLIYSLTGGLRSSILTDALQYVLIAVAVLVIFIGFPYENLPDISVIFEERAFNPFDKNMLVQFGIASAIGLLFSVFADHQQWQRIFAIKAGEERKTFIKAGFLHFSVTFSLGTLGVLVALSGFSTDNSQLSGIQFISTNMPFAFTVIFVFMALCGLCSTIDSAFCAFGGLIATEVSKSKDKIKVTRQAMVILALLGLSLLIFRLPILTLWFLAGTLRLSAFTPTVASIILPKYRGIVGTISIISGIMIGGGIFIFGIVQDDAWIRTLGMIASIGISTIISILLTLLPESKKCKFMLALVFIGLIFIIDE